MHLLRTVLSATLGLVVAFGCGGSTKSDGDNTGGEADASGDDSSSRGAGGEGAGGEGADGGTGGVNGSGASGGSVSNGGTGGSMPPVGTGGSFATGGTAGVAGTAGAGNVPPSIPGRLGRRCVSDAACGDGMVCVTSDSTLIGGQGPAKGICTADCSGFGNTCANFGPDAVCIRFDGGAAFCMEGCSFGPRALTTFESSKCHGRPEMACSPFTDGSANVIPTCLPRCNSDADCEGLFCDPTTGLCDTEPSTGAPVGTPCDTSGPNTCRGTCNRFFIGTMGDTTSMCGEQCTTGAGNVGEASCGWAGPGSGVADAFCLFSFGLITSQGGPGYGDLGACAPLCDCNDDCANKDLVCRPIEDTEFTNATGRLGVCASPAVESDGGPAPQLTTCP